MRSTKSLIDYSCGKCRKRITDWRAVVRDDGKISLTAHCHGDTHEFVIAHPMAGVLFVHPDPSQVPNRDPKAWRD